MKNLLDKKNIFSLPVDTSRRSSNEASGQGFTIVELAVSMLIIGLISTIVLTNYNAGRKQEALNRSTQRLIVAIRQAQNYALFSRVGTKCSAPTGGYGVYVSSASQYVIFGDCNGNHLYDSAADDLVSAIKVESGVQISGEPSMPIPISMTFEPPIGEFYYNGSTSTISHTIILQNSSDAIKNVNISVNGSVSVQ